MSVDTNRMQYLDSLRGIAALIVVWFHFSYGFGNPLLGALSVTPLILFFDGFAAVSFFFVLSGYVLSARYLAPGAIEQRARPAIGPFFVLRFFRIMVPLLFVMGVSWIAMYFTYDVDHPHSTVTVWLFSWWGDAPQLDLAGFVHDWFVLVPHDKYILVPQAWTLRTEMLYSMLIPFMIFLAQRSSFLLVGVMTGLFFFTPVDYYSVHFTLGVLIAKHIDGLSRWVQARGSIVWCLLWLVSLALLTYRFKVIPGRPDTTFEQVWILSALGSAVLIVLVSASTRLSKFMSHSALTYLGKISYSVYLCHIFIMLAVVPVVLDVMGITALDTWQTLLLTFVLVNLLTLLVSDLCYRCFEGPAIRVGRVFARAVSSTRLRRLPESPRHAGQQQQ